LDDLRIMEIFYRSRKRLEFCRCMIWEVEYATRGQVYGPRTAGNVGGCVSGVPLTRSQLHSHSSGRHLDGLVWKRNKRYLSAISPLHHHPVYRHLKRYRSWSNFLCEMTWSCVAWSVRITNLVYCVCPHDCQRTPERLPAMFEDCPGVFRCRRSSFSCLVFTASKVMDAPSGNHTSALVNSNPGQL